VTKEQIDQMVNAFLCWKLPQTFNPDCYISFAPKPDFRGYPPTWPVGTNLFSYTEAKAMVEHMVAALSPAPTVPEGWRDIASAPKDGTPMLGWNGECVTEICWIDRPDDDGKFGWCCAGFSDGGMLYQLNNIMDTAPTHWMPLPAAPAPEVK